MKTNVKSVGSPMLLVTLLVLAAIVGVVLLEWAGVIHLVERLDAAARLVPGTGLLPRPM